MLLGRVREVIKYPLFFHEPTGKGEIRLTVLHAVVVRLILLRQLVRDVDRFEQRLEDVPNRHLLKNAALDVARQQPDRVPAPPVVREIRSPSPLGMHDAVGAAADCSELRLQGPSILSKATVPFQKVEPELE